MAKTADDAKTETSVPATTPVDPLAQLRAKQDEVLQNYRSMSFEELGARLNAEGKLVNAAQAGIGFKLVEHADDKEHFVGVELVVLPGWTVNESNEYKGRRFASFYVKTRVPIPQLEGYAEFIINDGSTGIAAQLADLRKENIRLNRPEQGVYCKHGFQRNVYTVMDPLLDDDGQPIIDRETNKPKKTPRLDPVTQQEITGVTFRLDTSG